MSTLLSLFLVLAGGAMIGKVSFRGLSLGAAGTLFAALLAGHFGVIVPSELGDVGIVLFMYAAGLRAGPRFFRSFRRRTFSYLLLGALPVLIAAIVTYALREFNLLSQWQAIGVFAGSLTNTSALAVAADTLHQSSGLALAKISEAYGLVYPFALIATVLFVRLIPAMLRQSVENAEQLWQIDQAKEDPPLIVSQFRVSNANCVGKTLGNLNLRNRREINISRIDRNDESLAPNPDLKLCLGDIITLVGRAELFSDMEILIGEQIQNPVPMSEDIEAIDLEVSDPALTHGSLRDLALGQNYAVIVTRVRRQGIEFIASAETTLDIGDQIRVVGEPEDIERFSKVAGSRMHLINETSMVPFSIGILLGILLGSVPISLFGLLDFSFGSAGGVFITGLCVGHIGRIGRISFYVPQAASNLCQELGLMLFLACAGTVAGQGLLATLYADGASVCIAGAAVTIIALGSFTVLARFIFRLNLLGLLGGGCGIMNSATGLGSVRSMTQSELPPTVYAAVYPISLFFKIVCAHLLALL